MHTSLSRSALLLGAAILFSSCSMNTLTLKSPNGDKTVDVKIEISDNPSERTAGLMNRQSLDANTGMLFVFPQPQALSFWMKNTLIPLDILYFDANGRFVNSVTMQPCVQDPCPSYKALEPSQFALEVNKGFREANEIGVGWSFDVREVEGMATPE